MNGCMNNLTLQKMRYLVSIAENGSITKAARMLFVSQPSLTKTIQEIEDEIGFPIFDRTHTGIRVTRNGEEFLVYVRQVLDHADILQEKYLSQGPCKKQYCVSTLHYSFAVRAFIELVKKHQYDEFDFSIRETQMGEIIEDVSTMKSALGVIYLNDSNEKILLKTFKERDLIFEELAEACPRIFMSINHPLAHNESLSLEDLKEYPYVSFEHKEHDSFYLTEEVLNALDKNQHIRVRDRATLFDLLIGVNAYTLTHSTLHPELTGTRITDLPLKNRERARIGIIHHRNRRLGKLSHFYIEQLHRFIVE